MFDDDRSAECSFGLLVTCLSLTKGVRCFSLVLFLLAIWECCWWQAPELNAGERVVVHHHRLFVGVVRGFEGKEGGERGECRIVSCVQSSSKIHGTSEGACVT